MTLIVGGIDAKDAIKEVWVGGGHGVGVIGAIRWSVARCWDKLLCCEGSFALKTAPRLLGSWRDLAREQYLHGTRSVGSMEEFTTDGMDIDGRRAGAVPSPWLGELLSCWHGDGVMGDFEVVPAGGAAYCM